MIRWLTGLAILFALLGSGQRSATATPQEVLSRAVAEYQAGMESADRSERIHHFHRAELLFAQLTDPSDSGANRFGIQNAELLVNQGNAALQAEQLGRAIVAYRRALQLDPDHARAKQNLAHARDLLPPWVRHNQADVLETFFGWLKRLSIDERLSLGSFCFLVLMVFLAASLYWRSTLLRNLGLIPLVAWLVLSGSAILEQWRTSGDQAVVCAPETIARAADSSNAPPRFQQPLPGGTEVTILEERTNWARVQLMDGRKAWAPSASITRIQ